MANNSIYAAFERMWQHVVANLGNKAELEHEHDDLKDAISNITSGMATVAKATKASQDESGNIITDTYETKTNAEAKLAEAKEYTDQIKSEIYGGVPKETLDTLTELATAFEENAEVVEALDTAITNKADLNHTHSWNSLTDKPFYSETGIENIVPEQDFEFEYLQSFGAFVNADETVEPTLIDGETYMVVFDDVEYECVSYSAIFNGVEFVLIGNPAMLSLGNDTGEHFLIASIYPSGQILMTTKTDASHKIGISHLCENIHTLDKKYLPSDVGVQSSWLQSDETAVDFIKDRTHYSIKENDVVVISETTLLENSFTKNATCYSSYINIESPFNLDLNSNICIVIWDGRTYENVPIYNMSTFASNSSNNVVIGDLEVYPFELQTNLNDDLLGYITVRAKDLSDHTVKVIGEAENVVKQLDNKYIKDSIARVNDVEDLILSKSSEINVSLSNKADKEHSHTISDVTDLQTALDEIDAKTTMVVTLNEVSTFAGNEEPTFTIDKTFEEISNHINNGGNVVLYDNCQLTVADNINYFNLVSVTEYGVVFGNTAVMSTDFNTYATVREIGAKQFFIIVSNDDSVVVADFTLDLNSTEVSNLHTTNKTVIGAINEVNDKASVQPDWNQNDETASDYIKNRPFYEEIGEEIIIEQNIPSSSFSVNNGMYVANVTGTKVFSETGTYNVVYDGTLYSNVVVSKMGANNIILGNIDGSGMPVFTTYPFAIMWVKANNIITIITNDTELTSHDVKIVEVVEIIHELDEKYIPYVTGKKVEGQTFTLYSEDFVAGEGAEIFNNYEDNAAIGVCSHAEGNYTTAKGACSHAEGASTKALGDSSHSEGNCTTALGDHSHSEGLFTTAAGYCQHVQGKYNIEDTENKYAHIVGNGTNSRECSNAHTVDWSGNAWYAGHVEATALILKSPNGTRFSITVGDDGVLTASEITE